MLIDIPNRATFIDRHTILLQRRFVDIDIERLWRAITTKSELDQWFMTTELDLRNEGKYTFSGGWDGWISNLKPPHHLQFNSSQTSFTRFEIAGDNDGVLFSLIDRLRVNATPPDAPNETDETQAYHQPGGQGTHWTGVLAGWHCFVDALEDYLAGRDNNDDYEQKCIAYDHFLTNHYKK